jgi:hypothetical protein
VVEPEVEPARGRGALAVSGGARDRGTPAVPGGAGQHWGEGVGAGRRRRGKGRGGRVETGHGSGGVRVRRVVAYWPGRGLVCRQGIFFISSTRAARLTLGDGGLFPECPISGTRGRVSSPSASNGTREICRCGMWSRH